MKTKRTVRTFAAASFFNDIGSDIIAPLWPVFLKETLGAPFKVIAYSTGLRKASPVFRKYFWLSF